MPRRPWSSLDADQRLQTGDLARQLRAVGRVDDRGDILVRARVLLGHAPEIGTRVGAVVSSGGRPDLAGAAALPQVMAPTLLLVGGRDPAVIALNREAYGQLGCVKMLHIVPGATHLFEEPGTLEPVASLASNWFVRWLGAANSAGR